MLRSLDTDQLKTFIAIAELGSFTRAAKEVNKTQSAVSMQMRRLEETVDKPLFEREGRNNKLTSDGFLLLDYARRIVSLNDEAVNVFSGPNLKGLVRFGTPDDYAERFLPPILARFSRSHPQVEVEVFCQGSIKLKELIWNKEIDLAVATHMDGKNFGQVIRHEQLVWITSPNHDAHRQDILPFATSSTTTCSWRRLATDALESAGRDYRIAYSSTNASALLAAVSSGLAVTVLPESAIWSELMILGEGQGFPPLPHTEIALLRTGGEEKPHVTALADHVIDSLSNLRPALHALEAVAV